MAPNGGTRVWQRPHRSSRRQLSPELTLEVGRRLHLEDTIVVEWTCNYGDGRLYRNVSIAELHNGEAITVTDYWGEPTATPEWRRPLTGRLDMPPDGIWKDAQHLSHY